MRVSTRALNANIAEIDTIGVLSSIFRNLGFHGSHFHMTNHQASFNMTDGSQANHNYVKIQTEGF